MKDFLALFKDPIFVSIPYKGGAVTHSTDLEKILEINSRAKEGAYFTVNGFANFREGDHKGRTIANVTSFNCNFLDIDLTPETRHTKAELVYSVLKDRLRPTAVVLTGKGLHVYWLYKKPFAYSEAKLAEYQAVQDGIIEHYKAQGADRQARDAARVLRIPDCPYYDKAGEHTCDVKLLYLNPECLYEPADIALYFKDTISFATKAGERVVKDATDDFDMSTIMNVRRGNRHHMAYSAALSLIQRAKDLASARKMFQAVLGTWESTPKDPLDWMDAWSQFDSAKQFVERDRPQAFIADPEGSSIAVTVAEDLEMERVEWLWDGFIARGKAHMLTGEPGLGKSQITMDIAARLSTGSAFPSYVLGQKGKEPVGVIILSAEDSPADTMKPRLVAAGADLKRIAFLSSAIIEVGKDKKPKMRSLAMREDAEQILRAIATLPFKVGLIIIDPISAFLSSGQDSNSNSDARGTLAQLQHTVMDKGIAMLMINHTNKNTAAKSAHMRSMGSVGWNAAARATFYVFKDKDDEQRRVFSIGKMNLAKETGRGFFYRIKEETVRIQGHDTQIPRVDWDLTSFPTQGADDYVASSDRPERKSSECEEEVELYMAARGEVAAKEGLAYMRERGFSQAEVYRAARKLGYIGEYGKWKKQ